MYCRTNSKERQSYLANGCWKAKMSNKHAHYSISPTLRCWSTIIINIITNTQVLEHHHHHHHHQYHHQHPGAGAGWGGGFRHERPWAGWDILRKRRKMWRILRKFRNTENYRVLGKWGKTLSDKVLFVEDHWISMDEQLGSIPGLLLFIHGNVQSKWPCDL